MTIKLKLLFYILPIFLLTQVLEANSLRCREVYETQPTIKRTLFSEAILIKKNGDKIFYKVYEPYSNPIGETMFFISGLGRSSNFWEIAGHIDYYVNRGYKVIVMDNANIGRSLIENGLTDRATLREQGETVVELLSHLEIEGVVHLVGHSLGAGIVLAATSLVPEHLIVDAHISNPYISWLVDFYKGKMKNELKRIAYDALNPSINPIGATMYFFNPIIRTSYDMLTDMNASNMSEAGMRVATQLRSIDAIAEQVLLSRRPDELFPELSFEHELAGVTRTLQAIDGSNVFEFARNNRARNIHILRARDDQELVPEELVSELRKSLHNGIFSMAHGDHFTPLTHQFRLWLNKNLDSSPER